MTSNAHQRTRGRPSFEPSDKQRGAVEALSIAGLTQHQIAAYLGLDAKTLRAHFRTELDLSKVKLLSNVAMTLVRCALGAPAQYDENGNCIRAEVLPQAWAICFLLKTRGKRQGWSERAAYTGNEDHPIKLDLSVMTDDELQVLEKAARYGRRQRSKTKH